MYKQKSEIIGQIQSYHKQVAELYYRLYKRIGNRDLKVLVYDLYKLEKLRENYLSKHKKVAQVMDCWLDFHCEKFSDQINDCLTKPKYRI